MTKTTIRFAAEGDRLYVLYNNLPTEYSLECNYEDGHEYGNGYKVLIHREHYSGTPHYVTSMIKCEAFQYALNRVESEIELRMIFEKCKFGGGTKITELMNEIESDYQVIKDYCDHLVENEKIVYDDFTETYISVKSVKDVSDE